MSTPIDRSEFGSAFHTALRKGTDSPQSYVTYNLLQLMPIAVNKSLYDHLCASLDQETFTAARLRAAALSWFESIDSDTYRAHDTHISALTAALKLHDHADWTRIASTLRHYGLAPMADYSVDERSHWIDGGGFQVEVVFRDMDGVQLGSAGITLKASTGEPHNEWYGFGPDKAPLKGKTVEDIVGIIDTARSTARQARLDRLEQLARPEIIDQLRGIPLAPDLDLDNAADARILELAGEVSEVVLRWPTRHDGKDCISYVYATPSEGAEFGREFWRTTVDLNNIADAKMSKSFLQRWLDGDHGTDKSELSYEIATDDDLIRGLIFAKRTDDGIQLEACIKKVGRNEEVLSSRGLGYETVNPRTALSI